MNNWSKTVVGVIAATSLAGLVPSLAFASASSDMTAHKVEVTTVSPASNTVIDLNTMGHQALSGKEIVLTATHTMGMMMQGSKLVAVYDGMEKGFKLKGRQMLMPGVTYSVSATWASIPMKYQHFTIPDLLRVKQVGKHQLEVFYDKKVDVMSATSPGNYWIQSNQAMASGIAELGKSDKVTPTDGLTKSEVKITQIGASGRQFLFTFASPITAGVKYKLIPCGVSANHAGMYMGPNFTSTSKNQFVGSH